MTKDILPSAAQKCAECESEVATPIGALDSTTFARATDAPGIGAVAAQESAACIVNPRDGLSSFTALLFQLQAQPCYDAVGSFHVIEGHPVQEAVDPRSLQAHGGVERLPSLVGQNDELRPPVMRVRLECDVASSVQIVDDALHILPVRAIISPS